uniref:Zinc finger protein 511 n=1 Tax=Lygus hesperus TaxID=30085 RepID=A0A146KJS5_LYGHE
MAFVVFVPTAVVLEQLKDEAEKMLETESKGPKYFNDELFKEGNEACGMYAKTCIVDEDTEDLCHEVVKNFKCDIPNCDLMFDNLLKYELHYNSCHRFSCSQCRKHLPSPHLLDLHLSETHDSFFKVQSERKPMYRCFVESCQIMSSNPGERKKHCIEAHKFPHDFHFESKKKKSMTSKKKKPQPKQESNSSMSVDPTPLPSGANEKTLPATKPVFTFGRKTGGKSFSKNSKRSETKIEMGELMDTLPDV